MEQTSRNEQNTRNSRSAVSGIGVVNTAQVDSILGRTKRVVRSAEGAELYEFAMALPLMLVLVVGIIDFAGAYNTKHITANAAREAARMISSTPLSDSA